MGRWLFILVLILIGVVALGVYEGWFSASTDTDGNGTQIKFKIHRGNVKKDVEAYQKKAEASLKEFDERIEELQVKVKKADAETKAKLNEVVRELKGKKEEAKRQLAELKSASAENWQKAKSKMEAALDDLKKGFGKAMSRFKGEEP